MFIPAIFITSPQLETTRTFIHNINGQTRCGTFAQWNTAQQEHRMNQDKYNLMDESRRRNAELRKVEQKGYMQYGSTCMKSKAMPGKDQWIA